ncbi:mitochondrial protein Pet127-domain-containing protein [Xylogone sp. PMI_703]|nr:mitochondrial protein Pet127-domain-containing protein [Xylogone sp. PMI_703]
MFSHITHRSSRIKPAYICLRCLCAVSRLPGPRIRTGIGGIQLPPHAKTYSTTPTEDEVKDAQESSATPNEITIPEGLTKNARKKLLRAAAAKPISKSKSSLQELRQALAEQVDETKEGSEDGVSDEKAKKKPSKKKKKKDADKKESATQISKDILKEAPEISIPMNSHLIKLLSEGKLSKQQRSRVLRYLRNNLEWKPDGKPTSKKGRKSKNTAVSDLSETGETLSTRLKTFQSLRDALEGKDSSRIRRMKSASTLEKRPGTTPLEIETIDSANLHLTPVEKPQPPVPKLSYGLERVLFNPGVYQLQDPRSRVYNFDPYLQTIMPVSEFDFNALKEYITSSQDTSLLDIATAEKKKYSGSTSSMTSGLAHFHFLLSQWRPIYTGTLSQDFPVQLKSFTALQRGPSAIFLRWRDGTYAIDADKQYDTANILSMLGKSMEKLLTLSTEEYEKYRKVNSDQITEEERDEAESFHYTTMGDFLMRSQLDAHDPRLPGTGMFDLKTRAVVSIRMDAREYEKGMGYEIRSRHGEWESYEREYYDMIRAAFLKYSLQVRMGRMDGIFVAYHNTERIFGFQYISQPEMDLALHGTEDPTTGDSEFKLSLELLNRILDRATSRFPEKSLRIHFETREAKTPFMYIFAEPIEEERIKEIQETNKDAIREFESRVLGLDNDNTDEEMKSIEWERIRSMVEKSIEKDETSMEDARAIVRGLIEQSDVLSSEETSEQADRLLDEILSASGVNDSTQDDEDDARENEDEDEDDEEEDEDEDADNSIDASEELEEDTDESSLGEADEETDIERVEGDDRETRDEGEVDNNQDPEKNLELEDRSGNHEGTNRSPGETTVLPEQEGDSSDTPDYDISRDEASLEGEAPVEESTPATLDATDAAEDEAAAQIDESGSKISSSDDILAMTLTIRNKVNDEYVLRPENLKSTDKWTVEYALSEVPSQARARTLYEATKRRRRLALAQNDEETASTPYNNAYMRKLADLVQRGRDWRRKQNEVDKETPKKTLYSLDAATSIAADTKADSSSDDESMK